MTLLQKLKQQNRGGEFHEPSLGQFADMATDSMIVAKLAGAPITWWQALMPKIVWGLWTSFVIFLLLVAAVVFGN